MVSYFSRENTISEGNEMDNEGLMTEGYLALAVENKEFAAMAAEIAQEGIPEWE